MKPVTQRNLREKIKRRKAEGKSTERLEEILVELTGQPERHRSSCCQELTLEDGTVFVGTGGIPLDPENFEKR